MLKDIIEITKETFFEAFDSDKVFSSPKTVYDIYRKLGKTISYVDLVANHYLALDFAESNLKNSSLRDSIEKWRDVLNGDLKKLNDAIKEYLLLISHISFEEEYESIVSKKYNPLSYYAFIRDKYNIGFVEPCGSILHMNSLNLKDKNNGKDLYNYLKLDITTFESKKELQKDLNNRNDELKIELNKIKTYIQNNYILDNLL